VRRLTLPNARNVLNRFEPRYLGSYKVSFQQLFRNLHGIECRAFEQLVAAHPETQPVVQGAILVETSAVKAKNQKPRRLRQGNGYRRQNHFLLAKPNRI